MGSPNGLKGRSVKTWMSGGDETEPSTEEGTGRSFASSDRRKALQKSGGSARMLEELKSAALGARSRRNKKSK